MVTGALALVAGADWQRAAVLGGSMVALQVSIGALNDVVDAERDRGRKAGKPVPAGLVGRRTAWLVVLVGLTLGLIGSFAVSPATAAVAIAGTTVGYAYDLRLKASVWAWLPFALGVPLLPIYAWVGATGGIPAAFVLVIPLGLAAGAALALLNGLVDLERDRAAGVATPAARLGPDRARRMAALLLAMVAICVATSLWVVGVAPAAWLATVAGGLALVSGIVLVGAASPARRERGWEASAIGIGLLATGWAIGLAGRGLL